MLTEKLTFGQCNKSLHSIKVLNLIIRGEFFACVPHHLFQVIFPSGKLSRTARPIVEIEAVAMDGASIFPLINALVSSRRSTFYQQLDQI